MNRNLAQYYTEEQVSKLLISNLTTKKPNYILELGVGNGSLILQALKRWSKTSITGIDVDKKNVISLREKFPNVKFFILNGLSRNLESKINIDIESVDVSICNPPYLKIKKSNIIANIIKRANLGELNDYKRITSDLVFLARNLVFLKNGGELGIILPDGLLTSKEFELFRRHLLFNHSVQAIIELPERIFKKTEAKTHILIVRKGNCPGARLIQLMRSDMNGSITDKREVIPEALIKRMDYSFHYRRPEEKNGKTLNELNVTITRGISTKKELLETRLPFIHTSHINKFLGKTLRLNKIKRNTGIIAKKGDILMTRVGRNGLGSCIIVSSGSAPISDCVYRIRSPRKYRRLIFRSLQSQYGQNWIKAHSHGVCAKVISKGDLMSFRINE